MRPTTDRLWSAHFLVRGLDDVACAVDICVIDGHHELITDDYIVDAYERVLASDVRYRFVINDWEFIQRITLRERITKGHLVGVDVDAWRLRRRGRVKQRATTP